MPPRRLSEEDRKDLRKRFLDGLGNALDGDPGNTLGGQPVPDFLAGPEPTSPLPAWQWKSGRAVCDRWARGNRASILPGRDLFYRQLCEPYLGDDMPGDASFEPPFEGGQCSVLYLVYATSSGVDIAIGGQTPLQILGPLSAPAFSTQVIGSPFPDSTRYRWVFPSDPSKVLQFTSRSSFTPNPGFRIAGRVDGGPDNCGDPESEFDSGDPEPSPDPNPGPVGGPTGFPFPGFDITINPDGTIDIDFGDGTGPVTIDPGLPGGEDGPPPGDLGDAGESANTGEGGEAEGEAPPGSVLTAVKVDILETPPNAREYAEGVYRAVCYVYLGTSDGLDLEPGGASMRSGQLFLAEADNLTHWRVNANVGFDLSVTPYYREVD